MGIAMCVERHDHKDPFGQGEVVSNRVAVVTGGTRGIGEAVSIALKKAGYKVAANYAGNEEKAKAFTQQTGIPSYKWDVGNFEQCQAGLAKVVADLGGVEVLVNNAGITRDFMLHKMSPKQCRKYRHQSDRCLQHCR